MCTKRKHICLENFNANKKENYKENIEQALCKNNSTFLTFVFAPPFVHSLNNEININVMRLELEKHITIYYT